MVKSFANQDQKWMCKNYGIVFNGKTLEAFLLKTGAQ